MEGQLMNAIVSALGTVLVALIGYLAQKTARYLEEKGITEKLANKQYLVDMAVKAVEQVYIHENGAEKLKLAKKEAVQLLNDNGITITSDELNVLIESSVKAMNDAFKKDAPNDESIDKIPE